MSFSLGKAIDPIARKQIIARQDILQEEKRNINDFKFFGEKVPWVRLTSGIDVKANEDSTGDFTQDDSLARLNVLSNGVSLVGESPIDNYEETALGYRPLPGITSMNLRTHNRFGSLRTATVNFTVHSVDQLNTYEQLFMRPGYSALLEWGFSKYLEVEEQFLPGLPNPETGEIGITEINYGVKNIGSLVDFFKGEGGPKTKQALYEELVKKRKDYHYNYDGMYGLIKNFSWSINPNGSYSCSVDIVSIGSILESLDINLSLTPKEIKKYNSYYRDLNREERIQSSAAAQTGQGVGSGAVDRETEIQQGTVAEQPNDRALLEILKEHFKNLSNKKRGIGKLGFEVAEEGETVTVDSAVDAIIGTGRQSTESGDFGTSNLPTKTSAKGYKITKVEADANKQKIEIYAPILFVQNINGAAYFKEGVGSGVDSRLKKAHQTRPRAFYTADRKGTIKAVPDEILFDNNTDFFQGNNFTNLDRLKEYARIIEDRKIYGAPIAGKDLEVDVTIEGNRYRFKLVPDVLTKNERIDAYFFGGEDPNSNQTNWLKKSRSYGGSIIIPVTRYFTYTIELPEGQSGIAATKADSTATEEETVTNVGVGDFDDIFEVVGAGVEPLKSRIHYILSQHKEYLIERGRSDNDFDSKKLPYYAFDSKWNVLNTRWSTIPSQEGTGQTPFTYVQLGLFLDLLNKLTPFNAETKEHLLEFYTEKEFKHKIKVLEEFHFSVEPEKCLLPVSATADGKVDVLSLFINIDYIFSLVERYFFTGTVNAYTLLTDMLGEIELSLGGVNSFELQYFERDNTFHVVDREIIDPEDMQNNLVELNLFGKHTTVRNLNIVSKLSPKISTQLAIASQADPYSNSLEATAWQHFNKNLIDRFTAVKKDEATIAQELAAEEAAEENILEANAKVFFYLRSIYSAPGSARDNLEKSQQVDRGSILPEYKIFCQQQLRKQFIEKVQGPGFIIPYELSVTIEGFSGFNVMESFRIQDNIIPNTYKGSADSSINFIITGLEHRIDTQAWTTTVKAQIYNVPKGGVPIKRLKTDPPDDSPDYKPDEGSQPPAELLALESTKSIDSLHPDFKPIIQRIMKKLEEQGYRPVLGSAWRSIRDQVEKFEQGRSQVKVGNHNTVIKNQNGNFVRASTAVDIIDSRYAWNPDSGTAGKPEDYSKAAAFFKALGAAVEADPDAKKMFRWGGDYDKTNTIWKYWGMGWDPAHVEWWDNRGKQLYAQTKKYVENINVA